MLNKKLLLWRNSPLASELSDHENPGIDYSIHDSWIEAVFVVTLVHFNTIRANGKKQRSLVSFRNICPGNPLCFLSSIETSTYFPHPVRSLSSFFWGRKTCFEFFFSLIFFSTFQKEERNGKKEIQTINAAFAMTLKTRKFVFCHIRFYLKCKFTKYTMCLKCK